MIKKETLETIKKIIDNKYQSLTISILGEKSFTQEEIALLRNQGMISYEDFNFLELVYNYNYLRTIKPNIATPKTIAGALSQQAAAAVTELPQSTLFTNAMKSIEYSVKESIDKLRQNVMSKITGTLIDTSLESHMKEILKPTGNKEIFNTTINDMISELTRNSNKVNYDWSKVVRTEMSNAIGAASTDAIVQMNVDKDLNEVYVYRIIVADSHTCRHCKSFYLDSDGTPKVYRLSELLSNGSNYGKKPEDWNPVVLATHPNERCSRVLELKPGWEILKGGKPSYIGLEKWTEYIKNKVS